MKESAMTAPAMTWAALKALFDDLMEAGLSAADIYEAVGRTRQQFHRYKQGKPIPEDVCRAIRSLHLRTLLPTNAKVQAKFEHWLEAVASGAVLCTIEALQALTGLDRAETETVWAIADSRLPVQVALDNVAGTDLDAEAIQARWMLTPTQAVMIAYTRDNDL